MNKLDNKCDKSNALTNEKKELLKNLLNSAPSPIDFNKVRDEIKYGEEN